MFEVDTEVETVVSTRPQDTKRLSKSITAFMFSIQALLIIYQLRPLAWSPYSGDDVPNSQGPAWRSFRDISLWTDIVEQNKYWMNAQGRFFPGSLIETAVIFEIFDSRSTYKIFQIVMALMAWVSFVVFIWLISKSVEWSLFAGALTVFAFQFRLFHDPLLSFGTQQPTIVICLFLSLSAQVLACRAGSRRDFMIWQAITAGLWIIGILTYETLYPLILVPLMISATALRSRRRKAAIGSLVLPQLLLLAYVMYLRSEASAPSDAYQMRFESWRFIPTFVQQITGVLPFSYQLAAPSGDMPRLDRGWGVAGQWDLLAIVAAVLVAVTLGRFVRIRPLPSDAVRVLGLLGVLLMLVPSTIIGLTIRWQDGEVTWGTPYVSAFLSFFGLAALVIVAVHFVIRAVSAQSLALRRASIGLATLIGVVAIPVGTLLAYDTNYWVVEDLSPLRSDRDAFTGLVEGGLLDRIPDGATLITPNASTWFWENPAYIAYHGGPSNLVVLGIDDPTAADRCSATTPCWVLDYGTGTRPSLSRVRAWPPTVAP